jgi:O-antigen ligase
MLVASVLGLLVGVFRGAEYPRQAAFSHPIFVWLVAFILAQILSVYYGGFSGMLEEFSFWSVYLMFVVISILLISNTVALKRYVWGMIVGSMVVVGYGIYGVYAWGGYTLENGIATGRAGAYGMYENHNDYTFIITQILPFIYMYRRAENGVLRRTLLGVSLIACVIGVFMSLSRGGVLALVFELMLIVLIGMQGKRRLLLLPILALAGAVAIEYQWSAREENQAGDYTADAAEYGRYELWKAGVEVLRHNPFLGLGSRRFSEYAREYYDLSHDMVGKNSHNTYVEIFSNSGLIGFSSFVFMSYYLWRGLARRSKNTGPPWLDATRVATLISFYSILFRALLDAKEYDWSFYVLCSIGLACVALQRQIDSSLNEGVGVPASPRANDRTAEAAT